MRKTPEMYLREAPHSVKKGKGGRRMVLGAKVRVRDGTLVSQVLGMVAGNDSLQGDSELAAGTYQIRAIVDVLDA